MTSKNLATILAPNILHFVQPGQSAGVTELQDYIDVISIVRFDQISIRKLSRNDTFSDIFLHSFRLLIDHHEEIFTVSGNVLDKVYTRMFDNFPEHLNQLCDQHAANIT